MQSTVSSCRLLCSTGQLGSWLQLSTSSGMMLASALLLTVLLNNAYSAGRMIALCLPFDQLSDVRAGNVINSAIETRMRMSSAHPQAE